MIQSNKKPFQKNHDDTKAYREEQRGVLCQKRRTDLTALEQLRIYRQWPVVYH